MTDHAHGLTLYNVTSLARSPLVDVQSILVFATFPRVEDADKQTWHRGTDTGTVTKIFDDIQRSTAQTTANMLHIYIYYR